MPPKKKTNKKSDLWSGELTCSAWKDGGPQDLYFKRLADEGVLKSDTLWSTIKDRPDAPGVLGAFKLADIQSKLKNFKRNLKKQEDTERALKGKSVVNKVRNVAPPIISNEYSFRPIETNKVL